MGWQTDINQRVNGAVLPAGSIPDWWQVMSWVRGSDAKKCKRLNGLVRDHVGARLQDLEAELIAEFFAREPSVCQRPHVEALLYTILNRDPDAHTLGLADSLPLPPVNGNGRHEPTSIIDRAVKVGEKAWQEWTPARRRREYLLLEFVDSLLSDTETAGRNERLADCLRLLNEPSSAVRGERTA